MGDSRFLGWLLASLRSGLVAVDAEGRVSALNADARRILERPDAEDCYVGRPCGEVLAHQPTLAGLLLDALDGGERPSRAELRLEPSGDAPARTIGFTLASVRDEAGAVRGAALLFRDLTPIERLSEQQRLRERLAALGEMAAGLAHEIRNPLASMEVLAGLLRRRLADRPDEAGLVDELRAEIRAMADTVRAGLDFVKPAVPARADVDPVALLEEALAIARARQPFGGAVERDYEASVPSLAADAEQLRAVLTNLIVNAFEAMDGAEGEGRLALAVAARPVDRSARLLRVGGGQASPEDAEPEPRELLIRVADSGPGVPAELRERIFYPFFTTKQSGSGVGLALAQKLVASHGGVLELESEPGGAAFQLHLPFSGGDP